MKKITEVRFDGVTIREKYCSTLKTNIKLKDFNNFMVCGITSFWDEGKKDEDGSITKENGTRLTEDSIIRWLNECDSFEYKDGVLVLDTENYKFYVFIKDEKNWTGVSNE